MQKIVPFDKKYDYSGFDCGYAALNNYLKAQAGQDIRNHYSVVFVALEEDSGKIVGFFTLSNASAQLNQIPRDLQKKLPKYPCIPAIRLGRLAVDKSVQGLGVGQMLLADAILQSLKFPAWAVMLVDAKDKQVSAFYKKHGFSTICDNELCLFVLRSTLIKLLAV